MKYPKRIAIMYGNGRRRVVTVYQTGPQTWRVYLNVDREYFATQDHDTKRGALASAKAWT